MHKAQPTIQLEMTSRRPVGLPIPQFPMCRRQSVTLIDEAAAALEVLRAIAEGKMSGKKATR